MNDRQYYSLEALLRSPKNGKGWFAYQEVKAEEAQRIEEMIGLSVLGYIHTIDRDRINHILNGHGEARREDEIPVTEEDILSIPQWIKTFDRVRVGQNRNALISILYTKRSMDG